jgi:hypothetical protein
MYYNSGVYVDRSISQKEAIDYKDHNKICFAFYRTAVTETCVTSKILSLTLNNPSTFWSVLLS